MLKCPSCGLKWTRVRIKTKEVVCLQCGHVWKLTELTKEKKENGLELK